MIDFAYATKMLVLINDNLRVSKIVIIRMWFSISIFCSSILFSRSAICSLSETKDNKNILRVVLNSYPILFKLNTIKNNMVKNMFNFLHSVGATTATFNL